ncbi:MAG: DUF1566 domain-containing protein, partial [Alphaproteobacteria bacterium]|nr:DUF1566 domain-containing protein [Alphaproteobacteria bacterium]
METGKEKRAGRNAQSALGGSVGMKTHPVIPSAARDLPVRSAKERRSADGARSLVASLARDDAGVLRKAATIATALVISAVCLLSPGPARAQCADPVATAGKMIYNADHSMAQYCDGTNWVAMGREASAPTGPTDGLVGWWKLDETSGTTAADSSGNGNDGTMSGGLDAGSDSVPGRVGTALDFDGTDDRILAANESNFDFDGVSPFSVATWVRYDAGGSWYYLVSKIYNGGNSHGWQFKIDESNSRLNSVLVGSSGDSIGVLSSTGSLAPNQWYHVAMTYDGSQSASGVKLFIDGLETGYAIAAGNLTTSMLNDASMEIGASLADGGGKLDGVLDDVRIYNRALSAAEVSWLHTCTAPGEVFYNLDDHVMQFCSDLGIHSMGPVDPTPTGCPDIGDPCDDGSVFAGISPDGNRPMYATAANAPGTYTWNNGTTNWIDTAIENCSFSETESACYSGEANTALLAGLSDAASPYAAAAYCRNLSAHGHDDWFLPAQHEMNVLWANYGAIGGFNASGSYWTSTEHDSSTARRTAFSTGNTVSSDKDDGNYLVRCVRTVPGGTGPTNGLVGWWTLDETSGTTAADSSGNGHDGTLQGGLDAGNDSVAGQVGTAIEFDGTDDYINIGNLPAINGASQVTLAAWMKRTVPGDYLGVGKGTADDLHGLAITYQPGGIILLVFDNGTDGWADSVQQFNDTGWHHVAMIFDGTQTGDANRLKLYVDGVQETLSFSGASIPATTTSNTTPFQIGGSSVWSVYGPGSIDDVRIYDRALSAAEIQ